MRLVRVFNCLWAFCLLGLSAQAVPQPAQIQVVQNLVIPGRVVDLMPDAMLLKAPGGEAFVLPRHLGVRLENAKLHPGLFRSGIRQWPSGGAKDGHGIDSVTRLPYAERYA